MEGHLFNVFVAYITILVEEEKELFKKTCEQIWFLHHLKGQTSVILSMQNIFYVQESCDHVIFYTVLGIKF